MTGNKASVWTSIICTVILLGGLYMAVGSIDVPTAEDVAANVVIPAVPSIPSAAEIAAAINIPDTSNKQLREIWDEIYADEVEDLENSAMNLCHDEFDFDDVVDLLEDNFGDITDVDFEEFDEDDMEITIKNLGLDDEDDREVELTGYFRVSYLPEEGEQIKVVDKIHGVCEVTSDDGDLEAELTLSL